MKNDPILKDVLRKLGKKYEYKKPLGGGGFSKVYLIRHTMLKEDHALKIMDYDYIKKRIEKQDIDDLKKEFIGIKERFINEAKLYKRIRHPNIVEIHDVDVIEDKKEKVEIPYITMDYINGSSLDRILKNKTPFEWRKALSISTDVLEALDTIHKKEVIHRDIKPANIMIEDRSGKSILIDLGIAKDLTSSLTATGMAMGTPVYMAPEQFRDCSKVTRKADIYSFGVVVYEMLTGEIPFNGETYGEIMYAHLDKPVPNIRQKNPDLPVGIENIIFKALAKEPEERYDTAAEFLNALKKTDETLERIEIEKKTGDVKTMEPIKKEPKAKEKVPNYEENRLVVEEPVKIEPKEEVKIEKKVQREPDGELPPKKENEQKVEEPKKENGSKRKFKYIYIIGFIVLAIAATYIAIKSYNPDRQYDGFISSANTFIQLNDLEKAGDALKKAREIKGKDTEEIVALSNEIMGKRIDAMKGDFETLKKFLASPATENEKVGKCREFLAKHQNTPGNDDTRGMLEEANWDIARLNTGIQNDEQYQKYIDTVSNLIKSEDYEGAKRELDKARNIDDTDEVKRLSTTITEGLATERKNGEKMYKAIMDKINLSQYQAFHKNYPNSVHLPDLRDRLKATDKNLSPEKYWDRPLQKNEKGFYELTFGSVLSGHRMIYIPEKKIWIDKYEVSRAQFRRYLIDEKLPIPSKENNEYVNDGDGFPAVVTFEEAERYCKKYGFRLPKKNEWEYVAGKGSLTYPWGNESPDTPTSNGQWRANLDTLDGAKDKDGYKGTAPVKSFEPFSSPFGVVNMAGNVWEWVQGKILKGGGYLSLPDDLKINNGKQAEPLDKEGFRCMKAED